MAPRESGGGALCAAAAAAAAGAAAGAAASAEAGAEARPRPGLCAGRRGGRADPSEPEEPAGPWPQGPLGRGGSAATRVPPPTLPRHLPQPRSYRSAPGPARPWASSVPAAMAGAPGAGEI